MANFSIKSEGLIDYTLSLQKINNVALPFAVQEALNETVKDTKKRTLAETTNKMFDVKRKGFFKANSGFKPYKAKEFDYNINKMHADVGMIKGSKPNEQATEQVGHQQTASPIKRSINPLGNKPQSNNVIDVLSKKPEFFQWNATATSDENRNDSIYRFIRGAARSKKANRPFVILSSSSGSGTVYMVDRFEKNSNYLGKRKIYNDKKTRARHKEGVFIKKGAEGLEITDNRVHLINMVNVASYRKGGHLTLNKKAPFIFEAAAKAVKEGMNENFIKAAEKQIQKAWKR